MILKKMFLFILILYTCNNLLLAQTINQKPVIIRMSSSYTSFPDTGRANGHVYDGVLYDAKNHYSDSSVIMVIPPGFIPTDKTDFVFWFHGWRNSIDSSLEIFHISDQFVAAGKNAILVLAETAKNAPDTYGGKLQATYGVFKAGKGPDGRIIKKENNTCGIHCPIILSWPATAVVLE